MVPASVSYGSVVYGNTLSILSSVQIKYDNAAPPSHLSSVSVVFGLRGLATSALTLTNGSGITITDATNWIFSMTPFLVALDPGTYEVSITTTAADGTVYTFVKGDLKVVKV